jgi:hypothetical protein
VDLEFLLYKRLDIPREVDLRFEGDSDQVKLVGNALVQPEISLWPHFEIRGDKWIFFQEGHFIQYREGERKRLGRVREAYSTNEEVKDILRQISLDDLQDLDGVFRSKGVLVLKCGKKVITLKQGKPRVYQGLSRMVAHTNGLSLTYQDHTCFLSSEKEFRAKERGEILYADDEKIVFRNDKGLLYLILGSKRELLGTCEGRSFFIGECSSGYLISCNGNARLFANGGWRSLGHSTMEHASHSNGNYIVLTSNTTTILDSRRFTKIGELKRLAAAFTLDNKVFALSERSSLAVLEESNRELNPVRVLSKNTLDSPFTVEISRRAFPGEVSVMGDVIEISRESTEGSTLLRLEPRSFKEDYVRIESNDDIVNRELTLRLDTEVPSLRITNATVTVAKGGRVKGTGHNALAKVKLELEIPTRLESSIFLTLGSSRLQLNVKGARMSEEIEFPVSVYSSPEEIEVTAQLYRHGNPILRAGYVAPVIYLMPKGERRVSEKVGEGWREVIEEREYGNFQWVRVWQYPLKLNSVFSAKVGDRVRVCGEVVEVKEGANYVNGCLIWGIRDPLLDVSFTIIGNELKINIKRNKEFPMEVFYGTQVTRTVRDEIQLRVDPVYSVIELFYYTEGLKWRKVYTLDSLQVSLTAARLAALSLSKALENFGLQGDRY